MKNVRRIRGFIASGLLVASIVLLAFAVGAKRSPSDTDSMARRVERRASDRLARLESYVDKTPARLPEDMVIYRYSSDTLHSWQNQFTVLNDDVSERTMFHRLSNPRSRVNSPLAEVRDSLGFFNFGPKWYLARRIPLGSDGEFAIIGLEVMNDDDASIFNGANRTLHLRNRFSIKPLVYSGGTTVSIGGRPQFKILYDSLLGESYADGVLVWIAFVLFCAGVIMFLLNRKTIKRYCAASAGLLVAIAVMYVWGLSAQNDLPIFSPILFAGGSVLFSLGAVILVNIAIFSITTCLFLVRDDIARGVHTRRGAVAGVVCVFLAILGIALYTHAAMHSIIFNSGISLELYKFSELSWWTAVVYASFLTMLMSIPMLLQMVQPAFSRLSGVHRNAFSMESRMLFALIVAAYMVVFVSVTGFRKEQDRLEVTSNRLAIDRDIMLEVQLRRVESQISRDAFIAPLSTLSNGDLTVRNRIVENYLPRFAQDYDISVYILNNLERDPREAGFLDERIVGGEPVAANSRFLCVETPGGHCRYEGLFIYYSSQFGLTRILLEVEPKYGMSPKGYAWLMNSSAPGKVILPDIYSYARYRGRTLSGFNGNYAYAMELEDRLYSSVYEKRESFVVLDGYTHFINLISDDEAVVISREQISIINYLIAGFFVGIVMMMLLTLPEIGRTRRRPMFEKNYFKNRMNGVLMMSLLLTLVCMAFVSVLFVYRRNEVNQETIMSEKVSSIQLMIQHGIKGNITQEVLRSSAAVSLLEEVSSDTGTDISLYSPSGTILVSTYPEVFERMLIGCRMDETAFDQVVRQSRRLYVQKETVGRRKCYFMYAPVLDSGGKLVAIICSPYTGSESYDFERDALMHLMTILTVFLILLFLARLASTKMVDRMFKPLSEMGRKMNSAGLDNLEHIEYDREDEISDLVKAYNRMVTDLSESTKRLAQAERDKAWSGMARQVAHEIKNPLTPMKLQLQRIIRLKQRNAPDWQEKFDEVTKVILDHIDILTDTANEFSTFAKLYTEEPSRIDLDKVLQEEISMFDNRDNVHFDYMGLDGACVMGPKPQLTRVFVNLINNAVQAVEDSKDGRILVSLRNSVRDGYYDIVVEDNGSGVSGENVDKLFTPNFTTKTGGSGLGLAISRSILERCSATIHYSKSFVLGGACFTIRYPKSDNIATC